jgi:hypothetical protein
MGEAWQLTGNHLKTAKWYEGLHAEGMEEAWIIEEAILARERQRDRIAASDVEAVDRINKAIARLRRILRTLQAMAGEAQPA